MVHRLAVGAIGDHRVVGVAGQDDPGADRDLLARQPVGIAAAVEALVLVANDPGDAPRPGIARRIRSPIDRVLAHHLPLVVGELGRACGGSRRGWRPCRCRAVAPRRRMRSVSRSSRPRPRATCDDQLDDRLGVLAGVAVALRERLRQAGDGVLMTGSRPVDRSRPRPRPPPRCARHRPPARAHASPAVSDELLGAQCRDPLGDARPRRTWTRRARRGRPPARAACARRPECSARLRSREGSRGTRRRAGSA